LSRPASNTSPVSNTSRDEPVRLLIHPLREKNYVSIGCNPESCTRPVQIGEDPRSGRWAGQGKLECGINATNSLDSANL
jgi:phosphoadenosine phosphosulfate reductase